MLLMIKKIMNIEIAIFERVFYFCKFYHIEIRDYINILKKECEKRGIEL